jgi:hypothetical protein
MRQALKDDMRLRVQQNFMEKLVEMEADILAKVRTCVGQVRSEICKKPSSAHGGICVQLMESLPGINESEFFYIEIIFYDCDSD